MSDDIMKSVLAHQYNGDADELANFVHPAVVVQRGNDDIDVQFERQNFVLQPGDWVVEIAPGLFERLTDEAFQKQFRKMWADAKTAQEW